MQPASIAVAIAALSTAVTAATTRPNQARALYFLDNNPSGASIVSMKISSSDGTLSTPIRTPTGGKGQYAIKNGTAPPNDTTFSQDIVTVSGDFLFTTNCGSSTVSMFRIPSDDPWHPVLVGRPAPTFGSFPNSVAYSPNLRLACAITTGTGASITCFDVHPETGLRVKGGPISLPSVRQSTPPNGPGGTASDVVFNPSQTALFVTVKSNITASPGYIYAFPIDEVSGSPAGNRVVVSRPASLFHDFSLTFLNDNGAVISDTVTGVAILDISSTLDVTVWKSIIVPGNKASCWTVYAREFNSIYVMDGGNSNVTEVDPSTGSVRFQFPGPPNGNGAFDAARQGRYLYNLEGAAGIAVFDLYGTGHPIYRQPKLIQNFDLSPLGSRQGYEGLAVYPNA